MLISLHVKNLALIEEEEVFFTNGLNILTGETGAGKSIILGSVNLALGARADKDYIRTGAEYALVELVFALDNEKQKLTAHKLDIPLEEDNILVIQRKVMPTRSICKANGESISAASLKAMASVLLDIHGQHEHQSLLKVANHREILDVFAASLLHTYKEQLSEQYKKYIKLKGELDKEEMDEASRKREIDFISYEIEEISNAKLLPGEDAEAEHLFQKILNAKKIQEAANLAYGLTGYEERNAAGETIGHALRELRSAQQYDEEIDDLLDQLQGIDNLLNDFNRSMANYLSRLSFEDEIFLETEERLNTINHLKSKYGSTIEQINLYKEEKEERLLILQDYDRERQKLKDEYQSCKEAILKSCGKISKIRREQGEVLTKQLLKALKDLNFIDVTFQIQIESREEEYNADGFDKVEFMISTNPGESIKPLHQIASGGELSRVMLALKTVLAKKDAVNTLIFDEIDAGISGKTAWKVSEKLGVLATEHQIICITHLPQIAAMADSHYVIRKAVKENRTITSICKLNEKESIHELARLLGSEIITDTVLNNAKEMKELAEKTKKNTIKN